MRTPEPPRPANELLRIGGRRLDVRIVGPGESAPSLVFLHEGLGSIQLWKSYPAAVAKATNRRALVYSRFGHGWSEVQHEPRPIDFMDNEAFVVLPELIEAFGVADPILVGHSDGASIALLYASRHPVRGMVLLAPHVFTEPSGLEEIRRARARMENTDLAERMARYHLDPVATFTAWNNVWLNPEFESWNIESALPAVTCPVLLIQGADDEYGTMDQIEAVAAQLGGAVTRLVLSECRHSPHLDRHDATTDATAEFIRSVGMPGGDANHLLSPESEQGPQVDQVNGT